MWIVALILGAMVLFLVSLYWDSVKKRTNLKNYLIFLMLSDELFQNHKAKFQQWVREQRPKAKDAMHLTIGAQEVIEEVADNLSGTSATGAHASLWNFEKSR